MGEIDQRDLASISAATTDVLAADWGLDDPIELIGNVENCVYSVVGRDFIVRVSESRHRSVDAIEAELQFIDFLAKEGLSVATPIRSRNGALLELAPVDELRVCVFHRAPGRPFDGERDWNPEVLGNLARLLAQLHNASERYKPAEGSPRRHTWHSWISALRPRRDQADPRILAELETMMAWHQSLEKSPDTYGLVHYDAHFGNFFVGPSQSPTLFDFDDACHNFFVADLMIPIYYAERSSNPNAKKIPARQILIDAYLRERTIEDAWLARLDQFLFLRNLEMYAWSSMMFDFDNLPADVKVAFDNRRDQILNKIAG